MARAELKDATRALKMRDKAWQPFGYPPAASLSPSPSPSPLPVTVAAAKPLQKSTGAPPRGHLSSPFFRRFSLHAGRGGRQRCN